MATSINILPRANKNLLSGKLQSALSDSANYFVGDNVPDINKLPTYILIDPETSSAELVKVYDVSGNNIYIKRGLNNGGVGLPHNQGAVYEERMTVEHFNAWVNSLEGGWAYDHTDVYTFSQVSTTQFRIANVDRTEVYTPDTIVRFNGSIIARVVSSSYSGGNTDVTVDSAVVPSTITSVEVYYNKVFAKEHNADGTHFKATGTDVNTGTDNTKIVTPKAIGDSFLMSTGGWIPANETWTYASSTTFTVSGDVTSKYQKGDKIRLKQGGGYKYFYITNVSYSSPNTTITVFAGGDYSLTNTTITDNFYSRQVSPFGFPIWFTTSTNSRKVKIEGNIAYVRGSQSCPNNGINYVNLDINYANTNYTILVTPQSSAGVMPPGYYVNTYSQTNLFVVYTSSAVSGFGVYFMTIGEI